MSRKKIKKILCICVCAPVYVRLACVLHLHVCTYVWHSHVCLCMNVTVHSCVGVLATVHQRGCQVLSHDTCLIPVRLDPPKNLQFSPVSTHHPHPCIGVWGHAQPHSTSIFLRGGGVERMSLCCCFSSSSAHGAISPTFFNAFRPETV